MHTATTADEKDVICDDYFPDVHSFIQQKMARG